jgi:hypothetical protein
MFRPNMVVIRVATRKKWHVYTQRHWVWDLSAYRKTDTKEMDITMKTLENIGTRVFVLAALKSIYRYSFVCLCCVVPMSMYYRLCLVRVCMKLLQNGRIVEFSKKTDFWCAFSWRICNKKRPVFWVSLEQECPKLWQHTQIMGRHHQLRGIVVEKTKLCERDCRILKTIVSKNHRNAAAKVTAELSIHHEGPVSIKTVRRELHKSNTWVISEVLHTVCFLFKNEFILQNTFTGFQCNLHCALSQWSNVWASLVFLSGRLRCWCVWLLRSPH